MIIEKCVLDSVYLDTFLSMAFQEGIITVDHQKTDNVFRKYLDIELDPRIKAIVLEQVTLSPQIIGFNIGLSQYLEGDLIENQNLVFLDKPTLNYDRCKNFPIPTLMAMLKERGFNYSLDEVMRIINETQAALDEEKMYKIESGKPIPSLTKKFTRKILEQVGLTLSEDEYSEEEYFAQEKRQEIYRKALPIKNCIEDYVGAVNIADRVGALIKVPTFESKVEYETIVPKRDETILFRITAEELGQLTYRPTLVDTLKLAREEATNELRLKLVEWLGLIAKGDIDNIIKIKEEIKESLEVLDSRIKLQKINNFVTYIGLPATLVSLPLKGAFSAIPGLAITIVGSLLTEEISDIEKKFKWAMFGNK